MTLCTGTVFVTLTGLSLSNAPTPSIPNSINVATSVDTVSAVGAASGAIGGQVRDVKFGMDAADRVAGRKSETTFSFVAASSIPVGGSISLMYPRGFFALSAPLDASYSGSRAAILATLNSVQVSIANTAAGTTTLATVWFSPTSVVSFNKFVITLSGFSMGPGQNMTVYESVNDLQNGNSGIGNAVIVNGVLSVSFASERQGRFTVFIVSNIRNPTQITSPVSYGWSMAKSGCATFSGSVLLDAAHVASVPFITETLRSLTVSLSNPYIGSPTNAVISFTPTNVNSFNRFVVTLHNFTSVPGQSMTVSSFSGFTGNPAASATIVSGVLTVTFTSGALTSGVRASFTVANVVNPRFLPPYSCSGAATYAVPNALDSTTQCTITESLRVYIYDISPEKYAAGTSGGIWISFMPTNVDNLNRLILKLDNFTSAPGTTMNVCCFSGMSGTVSASAVFGSVARSNVPGLRARWYHQQYNPYLPPQSVFDSYTPYFQNIVPNLDFDGPNPTDGLFLISGGLTTYFVARFDG